MRGNRSIVSFVTGAICFALAVFTGNTPAIAENLKFVTLETAPWASYDTDTGTPVGAFPDVVRELADRSGHNIAISLRPFARISQDMEAGDQDCTIILWNNSREKIVQKGAEVYDMPFGVVARKNLPLKQYADLRDMTVSVLRGLKITPTFDQDDLIRKEEDKSYQIGLRKIAHKRLDAIGGAIPTIFYMAEQGKYPELLGDYLVMKTIPIALQCSWKSPHLKIMPQLNRAIENMAADGTLRALMRQNSYF